MNTRLAAVLACCVPVLLSACGSSGGNSGNTSGTPGASSSSPSVASTGTSGQAPTTPSASAPSSSAGPGASIKADTTPKFASPSRSEPAKGGVVQIAYRDIAIFPDTVRVKLGSTIRWTNYDSTLANVTSEGGPLKFASKSFGQGRTYELNATKVGVIHYECTLYPATKNGTIEVVS
jgi:plastocyanin